MRNQGCLEEVVLDSIDLSRPPIGALSLSRRFRERKVADHLARQPASGVHLLEMASESLALLKKACIDITQALCMMCSCDIISRK